MHPEQNQPDEKSPGSTHGAKVETSEASSEVSLSHGKENYLFLKNYSPDAAGSNNETMDERRNGPPSDDTIKAEINVACAAQNDRTVSNKIEKNYSKSEKSSKNKLRREKEATSEENKNHEKRAKNPRREKSRESKNAELKRPKKVKNGQIQIFSL